MDERRGFRRHRISLIVSELSEGRRVWMAADISCGGLYCPTVPATCEGSLLLLEIEFPDGSVPLIAPARVVRSGDGPEGLGVAVEFTVPQPKVERFVFGSLLN